VNPREALSFELAFGSRLDSPQKASQLAQALLSMPSDLFPMTAHYEDRKKRRRITRESIQELTEAILFTRTAPDGIRYGEVEIESKGHPGLFIDVQWDYPRRVGLNSIFGTIPLRQMRALKDSPDPIVDWACDVARGPLEVVYGCIELRAEWEDKLIVKIPPP